MTKCILPQQTTKMKRGKEPAVQAHLDILVSDSNICCDHLRTKNSAYVNFVNRKMITILKKVLDLSTINLCMHQSLPTVPN